MGVLIGGAEADKIFPGLRWRSTSLSEITFAKPGKETPDAIQVLGRRVFDEASPEQFSDDRYGVIATLQGEECALYALLGWRDKFRNHPYVIFSRICGVFLAFIPLFVANVILLSVFRGDMHLSGLSTPLFFLSVFMIAFIAAPIEVVACVWCSSQLKQMIARSRLNRWLELRMTQACERERHIDLLSALTGANDTDVADEAKWALGWALGRWDKI